VSGTTVRPAAGSSRSAAAASWRLPFSLTPAGAVIAVATLLALGLRGYQLARPGHLLGVGDYDDGADFGSALWLIHGVVPYRDFVIVQPPGITLLMTPAALVSRLAGTAGAIAAGRILTAAAGASAVLLGGLLVRHRGVLATVLTCGIIAIYPGSVQAAHTVLLEPWLTAFCLAGAVAVFDGDRLAIGRRLAWGGAALGFAGAIKVWAIIPVAVIAALSLPRPRNTARFLAGVAAGFGIPVLPFAAAAPRRFYDSVIVAQLVRTGARTPLAFRLQYLTGLTAWQPGIVVLLVAAAAVAAVAAGTLIAAWRVTRRGPPPLEWFAVATAALVVVAFLVPVDFYYHYPAFLAPFLAMALALPAARLAGGWPEPPSGTAGAAGAAGLRRFAVPAAGLVMLVLPFAAPWPESSPTPTYASGLTAIKQVIPPGACVLTDEVALLISADRFTSPAPGCPAVVDGTGTSYALGQGRSPLTAGAAPAVAAVWWQAFRAARYVLLTPYNPYRIAWTPQLRAYFRDHFAGVSGRWPPLRLYVRKGTLRAAGRRSALSERPDHQPRPRLGAE
jgi:alpha-1,2-mannosyltransferase